MENKKGFTLIELVAVIVIIGILALLTIPSISSYIMGTKNTAYKSHEKAMSEAAESYTIECINNNGKNCMIPGPDEEQVLYLNELIDDDFIDKLGDPAKNGDFCNSNTSYVKIYNTNRNDFEYTACLYCSSYATENPQCVTYQGDADYPQCVTLESHSEWTSESRLVKVGCTDRTSGCIRSEYKKTFTTTTDNGIITITDKSGNSTNCEVEVKVDKTAPTCEITASGTPNANGWYSLGTKFTLTNTNDNESGVLTYGMGTSVEANFNKVLEQTPARGITRVFGYVKDSAGNIGTCSVNAKIKTEFTIHYLANGGTGTMTDKKCMVDDDCFLDANTFTRVGYTFNGWNIKADGTGTSYENGANVKNIVFSGEVTMYAQWTPNTYTIAYTLNYGTNGSNHPTSGTYDDILTVSNPTKRVTATGNVNNTGATIGNATYGDQTFAGWTYTDGNTSTAKYGTSNTAVTTVWENASTKVTAQYFKNLRSDSGTVTLIANWTPVAFNLPTVRKTGYACNWNTKSDGTGTSYASGASYTPGANDSTSLVLYARCQIVTYTITINLNGGTSGGTIPGTYNVNTNTIPLKNPTKEFYTFIGWTGSNGNTPNTTVTIPKGSTGDKEFTANFRENTIQILYYCNKGVIKNDIDGENGNTGGVDSPCLSGVIQKWSDPIGNLPRDHIAGGDLYMERTGCTANSQYLIRATNGELLAVSEEWGENHSNSNARDFALAIQNDIVANNMGGPLYYNQLKTQDVKIKLVGRYIRNDDPDYYCR